LGYYRGSVPQTAEVDIKAASQKLAGTRPGRAWRQNGNLFLLSIHGERNGGATVNGFAERSEFT
jgi:hypothetical protein